jgi:hypothetical protein
VPGSDEARPALDLLHQNEVYAEPSCGTLPTGPVVCCARLTATTNLCCRVGLFEATCYVRNATYGAP